MDVVAPPHSKVHYSTNESSIDEVPILSIGHSGTLQIRKLTTGQQATAAGQQAGTPTRGSAQTPLMSALVLPHTCTARLEVAADCMLVVRAHIATAGPDSLRWVQITMTGNGLGDKENGASEKHVLQMITQQAEEVVLQTGALRDVNPTWRNQVLKADGDFATALHMRVRRVGSSLIHSLHTASRLDLTLRLQQSFARCDFAGYAG